MKLRLKVLTILGSMWIIIALVIYFYSTFTLYHGYIQLEQKQVTQDIDRTRTALNAMLSSLRLLNQDWSQWDDAYHFMEDKNAEFIKSNLSYTTFENAKINFIMFFDVTGKLFYGLNYDLKSRHFVSTPGDLLTYLENNKSFTEPKGKQAAKIGILQAGEGYIAISSQPILTSQGQGPIRGALIMGYYFNDQHIAELSEIVKVKVHIYPLPLKPGQAILANVYSQLSKGKPYVIDSPSKTLIDGYSLIYSIESKPIGILRIQEPRAIYHEGVKTIGQYLAIVICIGIIFLISIWYLLKFFVLDRVIDVSKQLIDASQHNNFSTRIELSGRDELTNMASVINSLLEIIELTQEQLKYRIFLRTEELDRLSKLNKNLSLEMSKQKEIEQTLREGEKQLRHMAYYDALTDLPNRVFFGELMQKVVAKAKRDGTGIGVLFIDADKFKSINDTYGHDIGDKFLQHTAQQLKASIKESDIVARLSGDEFILCLNNIRSKELIDQITEKILRNISKPLQLNGFNIYSTFSIGISIFPQDGSNIETLERNADLAMYYAKTRSGNTYYYYDEVKKIITE